MEWKELKAIYTEAAALPSAERRAAYLDEACAGQSVLRSRIESLLKARENMGDFLEAPVLEHQNGADSALIGAHIGPWKILEQIGEGGFGIVYMAEQGQPVRRKVALKVIKAGMDTKQVIARFEAERQALAMMDHPNIARVFDAGETGTARPYFVMELVKGIPITEFCEQEKLGIPERLGLFIQVCNAVQHAHQKGIIHRDIKPSNVMITRIDGRPVPKVIDFGVAKAIQQRLTEKTLFTRYDQLIGTPAYMSPEQADLSGQDVDTRSDIYSLGCLLYELLTGTPPIDSETLRKAGLDEIRRLIRETDPPKPSTRLQSSREKLKSVAVRRATEPAPLCKSLRGDLDWIVMKCLEKERSRRYATANALGLDIQRHLRQEIVLAGKPSFLYRAAKFIQRNRLPVIAAATVFSTLLVGTLVSTRQAIRATLLRQQAEEARAGEAAQRLEAERTARLAATNEWKAFHLLYLANMNLAQKAWESGNARQLRQLLQETESSPYRGFEWYYWQARLHQGIRTLRGHLGAVNGAAFSPDGSRLLTASWDRTAKVWETATGKELLRLEGHTLPVWSAEFSPDGVRIVTASWDHTARIWNASTGAELARLKGHTDQVVSARFSPDGLRIVTASEDRTVRVWDALLGREQLVFRGHSAPVAFAVFSPDGREILSGSWDETAQVWEAATGEVRLVLASPFSGTVSTGAFAPAGNRIFIASHRGIGIAWDRATGQRLFSLEGQYAGINSLAVSGDNRWILTSSDNSAQLWDSGSGFQWGTLKGHEGGIWSAVFSPDGSRIATASWDETVRIWETAQAKEFLTFEGHQDWGRAVAFSPDGMTIASASLDKTTILWDIATGSKLLTLTGHDLAVQSLAFSPEGGLLLTGSDDRTVKLWDLSSGESLLTVTAGASSVRSLAFFPEGSRFISASGEKEVKIWDAATGKLLQTLSGPAKPIQAVAVSPEGTRALAAGQDGSTIWDLERGQVLFTIEHNGLAPNSALFSPDGTLVACAFSDATARVWDALTGQPRLSLSGHREPVWSLAFSPDSRRILTGSQDRTLKLWDTSNGKEVLALDAHAPIWAVAFSPDGRQIAAREGSVVALWRSASPAEVLVWQKEETKVRENLERLKQEQSAQEEAQRLARAADPGAIKKWLVLLPLRFHGTAPEGVEFPELNTHGITLPVSYDARPSLAALRTHFIPGENWLTPRAGERVKAGDAELAWESLTLDDYLIPFEELANGAAHRSIAYAVSYIHSPVRQKGLRMQVACDDRARVFLNGDLVYDQQHLRDYLLGYDEVEGIELNAGMNVLVFKVVNEDGGWLGSIHIANTEGGPVPGLFITLDPSLSVY